MQRRRSATGDREFRRKMTGMMQEGMAQKHTPYNLGKHSSIFWGVAVISA